MSAPEIIQPLPTERPWALRPKRLVVALLLIALAIAPGQLGAVTREMMTDAYTQVSVFVAATLLLFYGAERLFNFNLGGALKKSGIAQVPLAALLGSTPGCGGAVVVVAAYSSGNVSFGAVVATLTATMGDAAFLLIATRPDAALVVLPMSLVVGIISGWVVDKINKTEFRNLKESACAVTPLIGRTRPFDYLYLVLAVPGIIIGGAQLAQIELTSVLGIDATIIGVSGVFVGLFIWSTSKLTAMTNLGDSPVTRVAEETSFISVWVIGAYLMYEYAAVFTGLDIGEMFQTIAPLLPLIAIIIGFIPGCGPQVLVATLFVNGVIPFAALAGNSISNDGDALFPAIALNPRAAFAATAYSAIPAFIVAYGFYFLAPGFMN